MEKFYEVCPGIYLLKVPFGPVWTGVVLLTGEKNILIDSSATGADVDSYVLPALEEMGLKMENIHYLLCTHTHGDHMGGHARLRQLGSFRVAAFAGSKPKLEDPVPYAIATRTRFPENSPAPQSFLQGVKVDMVLQDGDVLENRLQLVHTPGHDDDCVCWLDLPTGTLITGDSLQANGTICQGVGFYKSLPDYRATLEKLKRLPVENILCGHDYEGIGDWIRGKEAVGKALAYCDFRVAVYDAFVRANREKDPVTLAQALIDTHGCGQPEHLFMALYTVTEHRKEIEHG